MNRLIEIAAMVLGGLSLFAVCFVGFTTLSGVPLNEVPGIGGLFPTPEEKEESSSKPPTVATRSGPERTEIDLIRSGLGSLGAWSLPAPYSASELRALQEELKGKLLVLERREAEVSTREQELEAELDLLRERFESIDQLRVELEDYERELDLREQEIRAAEDTAQERMEGQWSDVADVLMALPTEEASQKLTEYSPEEAAQVLRAMDPAKARGILNGVPADRWKSYLDAYTAVR